MSLLKKGSQIALFTFISRIFGLIRELFIAQTFGAGAISDSLNIAFKLPNLFRRIFAEGALSSVFIPIFNAKLLESKAKAQNFSGQVFVLLLISLVVLIAIMQLLMPYFLLIIAPGFYLDKFKFDLSVLLCRITMPYLIFISVVAFYGGILNSLLRFTAFSISPVIFNIGIICGVLVKTPNLTNLSIIVSCFLLIAGLMQVVFMFICLKRAEFTFSLIFKARDPDVKQLLNNMLPASISAGAMQLNLFIAQTLASFLPGAVSILSYADRIYQFPLSIIGISFGTVLLPELSRIYKLSNFTLAHNLQTRAIKLAILISVPASVGIWLLSKPIIHIIYERGAFNNLDTIKTAEAISAFSLGLPAFILIKILTPIFYANLDPKTPLKITIYSMIIDTMLSICLMPYFAHVGIALGSSIAAWLNVILLYKYASKKTSFSLDKSVIIFSLKVICSSVIMAIFILYYNHYHSNYYSLYLTTKISSLGVVIIGGGIVFVISALFLNIHKNLAIEYIK